MTLTVCKVEKNFGMWFAGMTAGFPPADAEGLEKAGYVTIIRDEPPSEPPPSTDVAIPDDWASLHHLALIPLAKKIAGDSAPEQATKEWAVSVIETELARRAGSTE